jgi:outer membrane protein assembly factor BamE (lipoprotein component of BamABCDE complex)
MRNAKHIVWMVAAVVSLAGCATAYAPTPFWNIRDSAFAGLKPGATTKADVLRVVGVPLTEEHFPRQNEDVWEYRYLHGTTVRMLAYVHFNPNGVYTFSDHFLDPAYQGGLVN